MKKIISYLKISVLLSIFGFLAVSCGGAKEGEANKNTATESVKVQGNGQTIAYVNTDTLLANYEFSKKASKDIESKQGTVENDISSRAKQLEGEILSFQQSVNNMTIQNAKNTEQALAQKQQDLVNYRDMVGRELMQEQAKISEKLYENVSSFLKKYAKEKGFAYILTYSRNNPVMLYADSTLDVTKEVLKGLNEDYKEKGTK